MDGLSSVTWVRLGTAAGEVLTLTSTEDLPLRLIVQQHDDHMAWDTGRVLARQPDFELSLAMLYPIDRFKPVRLQQAEAQVRQLVHGEARDACPELSLEADAVLPDGRFCTLTTPRLHFISTEPDGEPVEPGMCAVQLLRAELVPAADGNAFHCTVHPAPSSA